MNSEHKDLADSAPQDPALAAPPAGDPAFRHELRLALVLNGGTSLAIWMGGVVGEIDALRSAGTAKEDSGGAGFWCDLIDALNLNVVVDVVAGTSAGGINGALLATAIARGSVLPPLRDTWISLGRFEEGLLIRDRKSQVRSILDGEFFLRELRNTLSGISSDLDEGCRAPEVTLFITGTALVGDRAEYIDEAGQRFTATDHRICFTFRQDSDHDDFTDGDGEHHASRRLARAARATASFPAAFEPIYVNNASVASLPPDSPLSEATEGPDMHGITGLDSSRWVIDGGVLDNEPFRPLLAEIAGRSVDGPVDRVIAYLVPAFDETLPDQPSDAPADRPGVFRSVPAAFALPRGMAPLDDLERIERIGESASTDRLARKRFLAAALNDELGQPDEVLFQMYRERRRDATAWEIRKHVREEARSAGVYIRSSPESEQGGTCDLPWLPESSDAPLGSDGHWRWGVAAASRFVRALLNIARDELDAGEPSGDRRLALARALGRLSENVKQLATIEKRVQGELGQTLSPERAYSCSDAEVNDLAAPHFRVGISEGERMAGARLEEIVQDAATTAVRERAFPKSWQQLEGEPGARQLIQRFLWAEVYERAAAAPEYLPTPRFRFYRFGLNRPTWFLDSEISFSQKLMGVQLYHFGAFFKDEWRAYDWTWGRLDGAAHLVSMLVTHENLERADRDRLATLIGGEIDLGAVLDQHRHARERRDETEAEEQAQRVRAALIRSRHAAILRDELPVIKERWGEDAPDAVKTVVQSAMQDDEALRGAWTAASHELVATSALSLASFGRGREILGESIASSLRALSLDKSVPRKLKLPLRLTALWTRWLTSTKWYGSCLRIGVVVLTLALLSLAVWAPIGGVSGLILRVVCGFLGGLITPLALWLLPGRFRSAGGLVVGSWSRLVSFVRGRVGKSA